MSPTGETPSLYAVQGGRPSRLRAAVRRECPQLPGVYGMVNEAGELIYVGKAKCLRSRLLSYFRPKSRDPKAGRIVQTPASWRGSRPTASSPPCCASWN